MKGALFLISGLLALVLMSTVMEGKPTREYEDVTKHESKLKEQKSDEGDLDETVSEVESEDQELAEGGSVDGARGENATSYFAGRGRFPMRHSTNRKPSANRSKHRGPGRGRFPGMSSGKPAKSSPSPEKHRGPGRGRFPGMSSGKPAKSSPSREKHRGRGRGRFPNGK